MASKRRKKDIEVVTTRRLKSEIGPDECIITHDQFLNIIDACWEAWGSSGIAGDIEAAAWGRDIGAPWWIDDWLSSKVN